ncbi:MAG TPA: 1-acyl-sn-glycerol-3-phosphate acyltransferase [Acidobacteriota bacterium]
METHRVALIGHIGILARSTAEALEQRGHLTCLLDLSQPPENLASFRPSRIICFPFAPTLARSHRNQISHDLSYLKKVLHWAAGSGVTRAILRSHAYAYGSSMKNPGMMHEERISLLAKDSLERRWLQAEDLLWAAAKAEPSSNFSVAAVRLTNILRAEEGDFITHLLTRRAAIPLAGYDPRVQFLTLSDAAAALVAAVLSGGSGVFNISGEGTVSFRDALRAACPVRIPVAGPVQRRIRSFLWKAGLGRFPSESVEQVRYNWTISSEKSRRELGFVPQTDTLHALKEFLQARPKSRPERLNSSYDDYGLNPEYLARLESWFNFLRKIYWRVEVEGIENVPSSGPALLVANHRGFMPFDGVIHRSLILAHKNRHIRFLVIPSLFKFPFLSDFLIRQGGVVASQQNAKRLFDRGELVGIFPEGISGAFRMYKGAYQMGEFGKDAFAKMAVENSVSMIPAAVIGHVEIFPILARVNSSAVTRFTGWPYLPITPTFPLLPIPLPTKWHIRYLEPVSVGKLRPEDAENPKLVKDLSQHVKDVLQRNVDEMLARRKHIFFGRIFENPVGSGKQESIPAQE